MLADRREYPCVVIDVAEGGVALSGPQSAAVGEPVIVYIDQLGRVQGDVVRSIGEGFAIALTGTTAALQRYASRLSSIRVADLGSPSEKRREVRVDAAELTTLIPLPGGHICEIVDMSLSGADLKVDPRPAVGEVLELGQLRARVVRHSEQGVGVEFEDDGKAPSTLADRFRQLLLPAPVAA